MRRDIQATLKNPDADYVKVSGEEYLVEVRNTLVAKVPASWVKISATKVVSRFRPPEVVALLARMEQHQERLALAAAAAWQGFLETFVAHYDRFRVVVHKMATLDCLFSLAAVARQPGYVCPTVLPDGDDGADADGVSLHIDGGRHPMVDQLLAGEYVANDTRLGTDGLRCMMITGPNMGGKSSYIRQVALLCLMAQVGSFVPAAAMRFRPLDGIHTRMGASDNIYKGQSTFMVELQEAADILRVATPRSLVIMDELGRGTSTHDGVAIAYARAGKWAGIWVGAIHVGIPRV